MPRSAAGGGKSSTAFRTISEVSLELDVPQHVLRFWESRFPQVKPMKRGGGRRYYRPEDVGLLKKIRDLLYGEGYTIKGVQKLLREGMGSGGPELEPPLPLIHDGDDEDEDFVAETDRLPYPVPPEPPRTLPPYARRELLGILEDLEQLRFLLQARD